MEYTTNYHLPQWAETDRIMMDDFNQMCEDIESGLDQVKAEAAESIAELSAKVDGHKIVTGSYTGSGSWGSDNPNTLTLPFAPKLLLIFPSDEIHDKNYNYDGVYGVGIVPAGRIFPAYSYDKPTVLSVSGTTVSWYSMGSLGAQFNFAVPYYYVAIG